jgi:hypothetical protein
MCKTLITSWSTSQILPEFKIYDLPAHGSVQDGIAALSRAVHSAGFSSTRFSWISPTQTGRSTVNLADWLDCTIALDLPVGLDFIRLAGSIGQAGQSNLANLA